MHHERFRGTTPSFLRAVCQDETASRFFCCGVTFLLVCTMGVASGGTLHPTLVNLAPWIILIGLGESYRRVNKINRAYESGVQVTGRVDSKRWGIQSRYFLEYSYQYEGRYFTRKFATFKTRSFKKLSEGDEVTIVLDPSHPEEGIVTELFA